MGSTVALVSVRPATRLGWRLLLVSFFSDAMDEAARVDSVAMVVSVSTVSVSIRGLEGFDRQNRLGLDCHGLSLESPSRHVGLGLDRQC